MRSSLPCREHCTRRIIAAVEVEDFVRPAEAVVCPLLRCHAPSCLVPYDHGAAACPARIAAFDYRSSGLRAFDGCPSSPRASADDADRDSMPNGFGSIPFAYAGPGGWAAFVVVDPTTGSTFWSNASAVVPDLAVGDDAPWLTWASRLGWIADLPFLASPGVGVLCPGQAWPQEHREPFPEEQLLCSSD